MEPFNVSSFSVWSFISIGINVSKNPVSLVEPLDGESDELINNGRLDDGSDKLDDELDDEPDKLDDELDVDGSDELDESDEPDEPDVVLIYIVVKLFVKLIRIFNCLK